MDWVRIYYSRIANHNKEKMMGYFFMFMMIVAVTFGQFFIKKGVKPNEELSLGLIFKNKYLWLGGVCIALAPLAYINALSYIPLNQAYLLTSINVVVVTLIGKFYFKEEISKQRIIGISMILIGIIIYSV